MRDDEHELPQAEGSDHERPFLSKQPSRFSPADIEFVDINSNQNGNSQINGSKYVMLPYLQ